MGEVLIFSKSNWGMIENEEIGCHLIRYFR
jgi:hypothetical protein